MNDRKGDKIRAGDRLKTVDDPGQYHKVIKGKKGELCLENEDAPLKHYYHMFQWEIVKEKITRTAIDLCGR